MHQGVFLSNEDLDRNQEEWSDDDQEGDNDETRMEGEYFLSARSTSGRAETESQNYICRYMVGSAVISSSSSISVSVEEGSSLTCCEGSYPTQNLRACITGS